MKILHIIDNLSMGGAQSLLVELLPIQKEIGNEVTVLELRQLLKTEHTHPIRTV